MGDPGRVLAERDEGCSEEEVLDMEELQSLSARRRTEVDMLSSRTDASVAQPMPASAPDDVYPIFVVAPASSS